MELTLAGFQNSLSVLLCIHTHTLVRQASVSHTHTQVPLELTLASFQNSVSVLLPSHTHTHTHTHTHPCLTGHCAHSSHPWPGPGGSSSRGPPLLLILFRKPIQEALVGTVGQKSGSLGDETGPDLRKGWL